MPGIACKVLPAAENTSRGEAKAFRRVQKFTQPTSSTALSANQYFRDSLSIFLRFPKTFEKRFHQRSGSFFDPATSRFAAKAKLALLRLFIAFACRSAATAGCPKNLQIALYETVFHGYAKLFPKASDSEKLREDIRTFKGCQVF
jgi:hypothetical protein